MFDRNVPLSTPRKVLSTFLAAGLLMLATSVFAANAPHIQNSEPKLAPRTITLEEQWRCGGEDGDIMFGLMIKAKSDAQGNVYMLDNQLCQVQVFDTDGELLRTLSSEGEGPGEVRVPIDMEFLDDKTLGLLELFPAKMVTMALDGTPGSTMTLTQKGGVQDGFTVAVSCQRRGDVFLVSGQRATQTETGQIRHQFVSRYNSEGAQEILFCEASINFSFNPPKFVEREMLPAFFFASTVGPDGRVYIAESRDDYAISVYNPDGTLDRIIEREFVNWKRNSRDKSRMQAMVDAWFAGFPNEVEQTMDEHEPPISDLFVTEDGVLWVQHSRSGRDQPEGVLLTYDTFDPEGNYLQEVSVISEGDPAYDGLEFLADGRVLLVKGQVLANWASLGARNVDFGDDSRDEPMEVICCGVVEN
jgi:hypothetical protein